MNYSLSELAGWVSVNILVPVVLPFVLLLLPKLLNKTRPFARGLWRKAVQDSQLFWVATATCAIGSYELYLYIKVEAVGISRVTPVLGVVVLGAIAMISIVLVVLQTLNLPRRVPASRSEQGYDKGLVALSAAFVLLVSIIATTGHYMAASAGRSDMQFSMKGTHK